MEQASQMDREDAKQRMFRAISQIEKLSKANPAPDDKILASVVDWESKLFEKSGRNRDEYLAKVKQKEDKCSQTLEELRLKSTKPSAQPATSATAAASRPTQTIIASSRPSQVAVHSLGVAPSGNTARPQQSTAAPVQPSRAFIPPPTTSGLPQQLPVSGSSSTGQPNASIGHPTKSKPVAAPAPTLTQLAPAMAQGIPAANLKKLDELREPLEQCRSILRVLNVFGIPRKDQQLKEEFMKIFQRTTDAIKNHKSARTVVGETEAQVRDISSKLKDLRGRLEPRFKKIQDDLKLDKAEDVFELETKPFGLMERYWQIKGPEERLVNRLKAVSSSLGSEHALKRFKSA